MVHIDVTAFMKFGYRSVVILLSLLFSVASVRAQLNLIPGESFLPGTDIKKVTITYDDHTVWALTTTGKVYYKSATAANFSIFPPTSSEVVDDISGYSEQDIYFSVNPKKLLQVKNGIKTTIPLDAGITQINGIAVMLDGMKTEFPPSVHYTRDRLAIATDQYLYRIIRNDADVQRYDIYGQPNEDIRGFEITKSGIKGVEFKGNYESNARCLGPTIHSIAQQIEQAVYISGIPEYQPYGDMKCTLFNYTNRGDVNTSYQFWGTDNGLYLHRWGYCDFIFPVNTLIAGHAIHAIENIFMLNTVLRQEFVIAASDNGLYYTPNVVENENGIRTPPEEITFNRLEGLAANNVKNFVIDFKSLAPPGSIPAYNLRLICEQEIWLATEKGVKKVYAELDGTVYENIALTAFSYNRTPDTDAGNTLGFNLCGTESLEINSNLTSNINGPMIIRWLKDGIAVNEWTGQHIVTLTEPGSYQAEIALPCGGFNMHSKIFTISRQVAPEITFTYPAVINLCENETKELRTIDKPGYIYKWFRDNQEIPGEALNKFLVTATGTYRVEVSNCAGNFTSSATTQINIEAMQEPGIIADKSNYCIGETAALKIDNPKQYKTKWYKDGAELTAFADMDQIPATIGGTYQVLTENTGSCQKRSLNYELQLQPFPVITLLNTPANSLCFGETVTLSIDPVPGASYKWSNGETTSSIIASSPGDYFVEVSSEFGCVTKSDAVHVQFNGQLALTQPPESKICSISGEQLVLKADAGYVFYYWNGSKTTENSLTVSKAGDYQLTVEDGNGCKATAVFKVVAWCKDLVMPNAFSPNNDGFNDTWQVAGLEDDPKASITIYNRYGVIVFQTRGNAPVWDGKYRGAAAPSGVYFYVIQSKGSLKPLKGSLTLIR